MMNAFRLLYVVLVLFSVFAQHQCDGPCVKFKGGTNITAERISSVVLEFSIDKSCHMDSLTFTNVTNAAGLDVYCNFLNVGGTCLNPYRSPNCYCDPVTSDYRIVISFTGLHGETWRLTGELANNTTFTETININVIYALSFPAAPERVFLVLAGTSLTAAFPMQAHTSTLKNWTVQKLLTHRGDSTPHLDLTSRSTLVITGNAPRLTAFLTLTAVTSQDEGSWRLTVINEVGTDHVDFQVTVPSTDDRNILLWAIGGAVLLLGITVTVVYQTLYKKRARSARSMENDAAANVRVNQENQEVIFQPPFNMHRASGGTDQHHYDEAQDYLEMFEGPQRPGLPGDHPDPAPSTAGTVCTLTSTPKACKARPRAPHSQAVSTTGNSPAPCTGGDHYLHPVASREERL